MYYLKKVRKLLAFFLCIFTTLGMSFQLVSAHDTSYPIVSDKSAIINKNDLSIIETTEATLKQYDIYLYVELSTEGECFQSTTDYLAYQLYNDVFSDNQKGIVLVYSFYDEFEGYFSIKIGTNSSLDEKHMKDIISDGFNKYGTESEWITYTYKDLVKYIYSIETREIKAEQKEQRLIERESKPRTFNPFFAIGAISIVLFVTLIAILNHIKNKITIEQQEDEINEKAQQIDDMTDGFIALKDALGVMLNLAKAEQAQREKQQYIPLQIENKGINKIALEFSEKYYSLTKLSATASNFYQFENALDEFNALPENAKSLVTINILEVEKLYKESASEYAKQLESLIFLKCKQYESTPDYFKHLGTEIESCTKQIPTYVKELVFNDILRKVKP